MNFPENIILYFLIPDFGFSFISMFAFKVFKFRVQELFRILNTKVCYELIGVLNIQGSKALFTKEIVHDWAVTS